MDIKPIPTAYKGYLFRSRIEARYAVFFDSLKIRWEYEKEGYDLNGCWYLPDFYLPKYKTWIEIKGAEPTDEEYKKCELFRTIVRQPIGILHGLPNENPGLFYIWDGTDSSDGSGNFNGWFGEGWVSDLGIIDVCIVIDDRRSDRWFHDVNYNKLQFYIQREDWFGEHNLVQNAVARSKRARFESAKRRNNI